jgi:uncharacterized protein YciI
VLEGLKETPMPLFAIVAHDRPDAGTLRAETRPRHLIYLDTIRDRVVAGGPMDDEAGQPIGSIILAEFDDLAAAQAFAAGDPYAQAGLFENVSVRAWRKVVP